MRASGSGLHSMQLPEGSLEVFASGTRVGTVKVRVGDGWGEALFGLPASAVLEGETPLELRGQYAAFHYWFYQ